MTLSKRVFIRLTGCGERGISPDDVSESIEAALVAAYKKNIQKRWKKNCCET
jgi:hypothetical protein